MFGRICAKRRKATGGATTRILRVCAKCPAQIGYGKICESCSNEHRLCQACGLPCGPKQKAIAAAPPLNHGDIELAAYFIFENRNRDAGHVVHGYHDQDWHAAIEQLTAAARA
jgi:hypothetical protein